MKTIAQTIRHMMETAIPKSRYHYDSYWPVTPIADNDDLAALGDRLMIQHGSPTRPDLSILRAPKGVLTAGYVIGMFYSPVDKDQIGAQSMELECGIA